MSGHQGVLYKRRDVFTRQWRPRWFVLQPQTGVLTYYLFSSDGPPTINVGATPGRRARFQEDLDSTPPTTQQQQHSIEQDSVQYDVVPRGTIYLRGCHVEADETRSRPEEHIFCFVISAPESTTNPYCLATTTAEARDEWIQNLSHICSAEEQRAENREGDQIEETGNVISSPTIDDKELAWEDLQQDTTTSGLTPEMKSTIEGAITKYLPYVTMRQEHEWSVLFENKDGGTSYQRTFGENKTMIKSVAILDHHPKQIFNLVGHINRRQEYEKNVRYNNRLKRCNAHTFIDYYAYQAVWPTTAREFLVLFHWRVLKRRENERAILLIGFSYPEVYDLRLPSSNHVRADLEISLFLLELIDEKKTLATRILSYDLGGSIPHSLTSTIIQQQAALPYVITSHLKEVEPFPPARLAEGDITNENLTKDIVAHWACERNGMDSVVRQLHFEESSFSAMGDDEESTDSVEGDEKRVEKEPDTSLMSHNILIALILLAPVVLYNLINGPKKEIIFVISAFIALRHVILIELGSSMPENVAGVGSVSMQFSINLRGVLRFLAKRRQQEDGSSSKADSELSIVPIVVKAVGKAMSEIESLNCKKTTVPLLGIDGWFPRNKVDISILESSHHGNMKLLTITDVTKTSIEEIASQVDCATAAPHGLRMILLNTFLGDLGLIEADDLGSCLVVASPDSDGREIDISVMPRGNFNAVVVVGGVRLEKGPISKAVSSPTPRKPPKPLLALSVVISCPVCSIAECRRFAERIQELVASPDF